MKNKMTIEKFNAFLNRNYKFNAFLNRNYDNTDGIKAEMGIFHSEPSGLESLKNDFLYLLNNNAYHFLELNEKIKTEKEQNVIDFYSFLDTFDAEYSSRIFAKNKYSRSYFENLNRITIFQYYKFTSNGLSQLINNVLINYSSSAFRKSIKEDTFIQIIETQDLSQKMFLKLVKYIKYDPNPNSVFWAYSEYGRVTMPFIVKYKKHLSLERLSINKEFFNAIHECDGPDYGVYDNLDMSYFFLEWVKEIGYSNIPLVLFDDDYFAYLFDSNKLTTKMLIEKIKKLENYI